VAVVWRKLGRPPFTPPPVLKIKLECLLVATLEDLSAHSTFLLFFHVLTTHFESIAIPIQNIYNISTKLWKINDGNYPA
jgi:hypothetical protein